jgi:predicted O-methyltransferase YrrM
LIGILRQALGAAPLGAWMRDRTDRRAGAILLSRTANAAANDLTRLSLAIRKQIVLASPDAQSSILFRVIDDPLWQEPGRIVVGASISEELHPLLGAALTELCDWTAGDRARLWVQSEGDLRRPQAASATAEHLCRWILAQARGTGGAEPSTTLVELQQCLTSGGHRAGAFERLLDTVLSDRSCASIVEVGGALGLPSWLIAADERRGVRRVTLVDPNRRHELALQQLWGSFTSGGEERCAFLAKIPAYRFAFDSEADIVLLCQAVFSVPPEQRAAFFERCWRALKPGGVLIINEVVAADDADAGAASINIPRRDALIALLSRFAEPRLFREAFGWSRAEDPLAVPAQDYFSSSFIVLCRD